MATIHDKRRELETLATTLVQRSGLRELSFRQLSDQVGVKSSNVHYYFPEKGDRTATLIKGYSASFALRLKAIAERAPGLRRKLTGFVENSEQWLVRVLRQHKADERSPLPTSRLAAVLMS